MLELARAGDLGCRRVIADAGRAIGKAAAMLLNVLNPELLIVGGDLAAAGDLLLDGVRESLARSALPYGRARRPASSPASLGDRAEVLGAHRARRLRGRPRDPHAPRRWRRDDQ